MVTGSVVWRWLGWLSVSARVSECWRLASHRTGPRCRWGLSLVCNMSCMLQAVLCWRPQPRGSDKRRVTVTKRGGITHLFVLGPLDPGSRRGQL
ncbi:hypothetical protein M440DRAFT_336838 [Trichoderma longibrachiatum ATCC 18648]|uniref:Uncharacterized protein n=1 Tax=Trichoderma longibrachiatum ATCC 18648 TaxID=983965 RepID=A0A2T4C0H9_TRILO|nr:hypothetical protein M440DRAFT_336838 [Trichoderma longibrachiatum ATCC 18648]